MLKELVGELLSGSVEASEAIEVLTNERWWGILYNWLCSFQK